MGINKLIRKIDNNNLEITFKSRSTAFIIGLGILIVLTAFAITQKKYFLLFFESVYLVYLCYIKSKRNVIVINNQLNTINLQIRSFVGNLYDYTFEYNKPIEFKICQYYVNHKHGRNIFYAVLLSNHSRSIMFKFDELNHIDFYMIEISKIDFQYCGFPISFIYQQDVDSYYIEGLLEE